MKPGGICTGGPGEGSGGGRPAPGGTEGRPGTDQAVSTSARPFQKLVPGGTNPREDCTAARPP
eukprot:2619716-Lingulodinium_polyedra.AAC.1